MTKTMEKKKEIGIEAGINSRKSIEKYLLSTYGEKKMKQVQQDSLGGSSYTFLDVVGYTLDKSGYESQDRNGNGFGEQYRYKNYYELEEIEDMMIEKWEDEGIGSEDQ